MGPRTKQRGWAAAMRASNVLVVDPAKPPLLPYRPSYPMNSAIGLFGGVFLGFGFVLLRERLDRRISAPGEAQGYLDLPELGVIPLDEAAGSRQISNVLQPLRPTAGLPAGSARKSPLAYSPPLSTRTPKPPFLAECAPTP